MSNPHRRPMADNEVLVHLVHDSLVTETHGIRMPIDQVADKGVIRHEGKYFIFRRMLAGNPVFQEAKLLDLTPVESSKKMTFWFRMFR